ncbi:MAG: hypothetical protein H7X94_13070, partial [Vallitaleaceae bacterium]|nr:hypothetical protein [Vallitaleaceae bacterium]
RYAIYNEEQLISKKIELQKYKKPQEVSLTALVTLLKALEPFKDQTVTVMFEDGALSEQISGTYKSKNRDVLKLAELTRSKIRKFGENIAFKYIGQDKGALEKLNEALKANL